MTASRTADEKLADWSRVYLAVRDSLTPESFRTLMSLAKPTEHEGEPSLANVEAINLGLATARITFANDRAAATVAALLTQSGIKPTAIDYGDDRD